MIEFPRASKQRTPNIKVVGLGGAGGRILEHLAAGHLEGASFVAMNTDARLLAALNVQEKVQIGAGGVGAGGDPDTGYAATEESVAILRESFQGAELVFLCAGLGGGTGSGGAPMIANLARQCGATVVAFVTMPFSIEGKPRREQAQAALAQVSQQAQIVICFENDRMDEAVSAIAPALQSFAMADAILCQAIRALVSLVSGQGVLHVGLDELASALRRTDSRCLFGYGESDSETRAVDALDRALRSPLMKRGQVLADARDVVVHVTAGPGFSLAELGVLMEHAHRHIGENARLHLGVAADSRLGGTLAVTIISATGTDAKPERKANPRSAPAPLPASRNVEGAAKPEPVNELDESEPELTSPTMKEEKAEQMQFEPVNRGRFDKSEPTIVDGQDFDVPTFLRKGLRIK